MRRSPSPSRTDAAFASASAVALTLAAAALAGCSDDDGSCGPGSAAADGLTLVVGGETVTFGGFSAGGNNDCPLPGSPAGVVSVTVAGEQTGTTFPFTLCLPRPDLLGAEPFPLAQRAAPVAEDRVMVVDSSASLMGGCTVEKDVTMMPTGTARFLGYCEGGKSSAGYAIEIAGTVPLVRTCGANVENVTGTLSGTFAVTLE